MKTKDQFIGQCIDITNQGMGVVKVDRFPFFVENLLPNEEALIEITELKSKFGFGQVVKRLNNSTTRIVPICPHFDECGGCQLMMLDQSAQNEFKQNQVQRLFTLSVNPLVPSPRIYAYRNKMTFKVNKKPFFLGLNKSRSHEIVDIETCYLQSELLNNIMIFIENQFSNDDIDEVILRETYNTNQVMVIFKGRSIDQNNINKLTNQFEIIKSVYLNSKCLCGSPTIIEAIDHVEFHISPESFFQVNTAQCEFLYQKIVDLAEFKPNETVLDLYCGVGSISLYIAKHVKQVIGVEINEHAIVDANLNKQLNQLNNVEFFCQDATEFLKQFDQTIDTVIVDPPRKGLTPQGIEDIIKTNANKLIYVSCNPITLKRDLELLSNHYNIESITPFDMFPQTAHVETVVLMSRVDK